LTLRGKAGSGFGVAALKDGADGVSGLGDVAEVDRGFRAALGAGLRGASAGVVEVLAYALGLVLFDGTGMGLPADADGFERVKDGSALYFQLSCQIVDSYFAHPSLFAS
jgi:hypothetical protein